MSGLSFSDSDPCPVCDLGLLTACTCEDVVADPRSFAELTDPDVAKAADVFRAANMRRTAE